VVVVRFAGGDLLRTTLESLQRQRANGDIEVIVAYDEANPPLPGWVDAYPAVRWAPGPGGASPARLRAIGVRQSRGTLVACTEDHCAPAPDWCARIATAHVATRGRAVIGGAIDKGEPADGTAWAAYLLDYSRYLPPVAAGPSEYLSDCNVSYSRAALDEVQDTWSHDFHETSVHWALQARGYALHLDPGILVFQHRPIRLAEYLAERREHGRVFAGTRVTDASALQRSVWWFLTFALPPILVRRVATRLRERGARHRVPRGTWGPLWRAAVAWSAGERQGYQARRSR